MKNISILGATGSIGQNTLDLISRSGEKFKVVGLTGANNIDDLNMVKEFNELNCKKFFIHPVEGHVAIFPSRLSHGTECIKTDFNGERLSIVGDVNLILKEEYLLHSMGLIDEKYWKKYN